MKQHLNLSVDSDIVVRAKSLGINLSDFLEITLATATKSPRFRKATKKFKGVPRKLMKKVIYMVEEAMCDKGRNVGFLADKKAAEINKLCGTRVTAQDIVNLVPRVM